MFKYNFLQNQKLIVIITCIFWISTKILSYKLWISDRLFPLIPPLNFLENIPNTIHIFLFTASLIGIFLIALFPSNKYILVTTLAIEFFSCILDQNRWQPWEYQYFLTILFLYFYLHNPRQFINYFTFLIISTYFNSGIHKLNGGFLYDVWESMILKRFFGLELHQIQNGWIHYAGLSLGLIEVVGALGLLFFKQKKMFALLIIGMHVFILLLISPTGLNYNVIVWPWNIAMVLFLYLLFFKIKNNTISFTNLTEGYNKIPFLVIGVFPFFCFIGLYDNYMSFNLYSGTLKQLEICIEKHQDIKKYQNFITNKKTFCKNSQVINANTWALKEMNTVVYPETRVFKAIIKKWKLQNPTINATFHIYQYPYQPNNIIEYH